MNKKIIGCISIFAVMCVIFILISRHNLFYKESIISDDGNGNFTILDTHNVKYSAVERIEKMRLGKQKDIISAIEELPEISKCDLDIVFPTEESKYPTSVTVTLKLSLPETKLSAELIEGITKMVSSIMEFPENEIIILMR